MIKAAPGVADPFAHSIALFSVGSRLPFFIRYGRALLYRPLLVNRGRFPATN